MELFKNTVPESDILVEKANLSNMILRSKEITCK